MTPALEEIKLALLASGFPDNNIALKKSERAYQENENAPSFVIKDVQSEIERNSFVESKQSNNPEGTEYKNQERLLFLNHTVKADMILNKNKADVFLNDFYKYYPENAVYTNENGETIFYEIGKVKHKSKTKLESGNIRFQFEIEIKEPIVKESISYTIPSIDIEQNMKSLGEL